MIERGRRCWRGSGLAARLTASYVALLAVSLLALGIFLNLTLASSLEASRLARLRAQARTVERVLQASLSAGQPLASAAEDAADVVAAPGVGVAVLDPNGHLAGQSRGPRERIPDPPAAALAALQMGAGEWVGSVNDAPMGRTTLLLIPLYAAPPVDAPVAKSKAPSGPLLGYVVSGTPTLGEDDTLRMVLLLFAAGVGLILLIAVLIGPPLTRLGLRPLRTMARASRQLATGDLATRVPEPTSQDDVGDLAHAFNEMAQRLEAAFAAQRAFVADASHELRTPLTALGGQLDVLPRLTRTDPTEAERLAHTMRRELTRLGRLVDDLLVLARLDARGVEVLHLEPVDLIGIARDVYEQARVLPAAQRKDVRLVTSGPLPILGDPARLHQVLLNLMVNALQHTPPAGYVLLSVQQAGDQVQIAVRDSGPGIPAEHLSHLFDRFYRADTARARAAGGAGLGLSIARALVEAHGGTITATNAPAGGAIFTVAIPIATDTPVLVDGRHPGADCPASPSAGGAARAAPR